MKIPEPAPNVGAYYGSEENGQWQQPNGVIIDNGVGGGVVGSGDAGVHRGPVYSMHMPSAQMPGYVMTGAYYPPAGYPPVAQPTPDDFSDYMWMENEEEFDKQVMQQLEEEALMEQCIEAMLEDEQRERHNRPIANGHKQPHYRPTTSNGGPSVSLEEAVSRSTLNPLAAEFYPTRVRTVPTQQQIVEKQEQITAPFTEEISQKKNEHTVSATVSTEIVTSVENKPQIIEETKAIESLPPQKDPPEVSAADIQPIAEKIQEKRPKDSKKESNQTKTRVENKTKSIKNDVKKTKPLVTKSETTVQVKKEVRTVKSEAKVEVVEKVKDTDKVKSETEIVRSEEKVEKDHVPVVVAETPKPQLPQPKEDQQSNTGIKPINYAAAAKANKPKKPSPPPPQVVEKIPAAAQPTVQKTNKTLVERKRPEKTAVKDKPSSIVQRKNSPK